METTPQTIAARHEYRVSSPKRILFLVSGTPALAAAVYLFVYDLQNRHHIIGAGLASCITTFLLFAGVFLLGRSVPARFLIDGTRLEASYFFRTRTSEIGQIEGFYKSSVFFAGATRLRIRQTTLTLIVPNFLPLNDDFCALLQQLTDLDEQYKETIRNRIAEVQAFGNTPGERLDKLEIAKRNLVYFTLALFAASAALNFGSVPIQLLATFLLALAPVFPLLLLNRYPLLYAISQPRTDPRANPGFFLFISSYCMFFPAIKPNFVTWLPLCLFAAPIIVAYAAAFLRFDCSAMSRLFIRRCIMLLFLAVIYSVGLISSANTLLDRTKPATYTVSVLSNQPIDNDYHKDILKLAPWGPIQKPSDLHVDPEILSEAASTHQICLNLHSGFLRIAWYDAVPCTAQRAAQPAQ
jgi:hypothetical protein